MSSFRTGAGACFGSGGTFAVLAVTDETVDAAGTLTLPVEEAGCGTTAAILLEGAGLTRIVVVDEVGDVFLGEILPTDELSEPLLVS